MELLGHIVTPRLTFGGNLKVQNLPPRVPWEISDHLFFSFLFFSLFIFYTTASGVPLTDLGSKAIMVNMVHSGFSLTR